jgi:hypothetical protein
MVNLHAESGLAGFYGSTAFLQHVLGSAGPPRAFGDLDED